MQIVMNPTQQSRHVEILYFMEGYLSKKSIHINESFVHAIALALW